jgi:hypothetical protein
MTIVTRLAKGAPLTFAEMDGNFTTIAGLINAGFNYALDSGSLNTLVLTLATPPASYIDGMNFSAKVANTNTGAATLNINGLGAKNIYDGAGNLVTAGVLVAGQIYTFVYNSSLNSGLGGFNAFIPNATNVPVVSTTNNPGITVGTQLANLGSATGATNVGYTPPSGFGSATTISSELNTLVGFTGQNAVYNGLFDLCLNPGPLALPTVSTVLPPAIFDRWAIFQNTASAGTAAQVASDVPGVRYALKLQRNNGSSSTNAIIVEQAIKTADSLAYQGKNCVFSFFVKAGANYSGGNISVGVFSGTGIDEGVVSMGNTTWTGYTTPVSVAQAITTTSTQYQFTCTIPSNCTELGWRVFFSPTGTAGADDSITITNMKFEVGVVASAQNTLPYRNRTYINRPIDPQADYFGNFGPVDPFYQGQTIPFGRGNTVLINGNLEVIPPGVLASSGGVISDYTNCYILSGSVSGGVPVQSVTSLSLGTVYFVFVFMNVGVMTQAFGSPVNGVSHAPDPETGRQCLNIGGVSYPGWSLVGLIFTDPQRTIRQLSNLVGGSGYNTPGTYKNIPLTGGTGTGAKGTIVVAGGIVTSVTIVGADGDYAGLGYVFGDTLSAADGNIGGRTGGSAFTIQVNSVSPCVRGGASAQTAVSWNNRLRYYLTTAVSGSVSSTGLVELNSNNRIQWVQWGSDLPIGPKAMANWGSTVANDQIQMGIGYFFTGGNVAGGVDNHLVLTSGYAGRGQVPSTTAPSINLQAQLFNTGGEGYFYATSIAQRIAGSGTCSISGTYGSLDGSMILENNGV